MKEELKSQLIAELNKAIKPEQDNEVEDDGRVQYHQATHTLQINEEAHIAAEKEEEEKLISKMLMGDKDARGKLIEHNLRLVAHIVKKYEGKVYDADVEQRSWRDG